MNQNSTRKFYLCGHTNFGNRGCEALVRTIGGLLAEQFGDAELLVPSYAPARDGQQWGGGAGVKVTFVPTIPVPFLVKWWSRIASRVPALVGHMVPPVGTFGASWQPVRECDALLMIGGDNISLDYGFGSLLYWASIVEASKRRLKKPVVLVGASVGPFDGYEKFAVHHLNSYDAITVRETASQEYLNQLGVSQTRLVADSAFCLEPEEVALPFGFAGASDGVLGLNLSHLVEEARFRRHKRRDVVTHARAFIARVLAETDLCIALIPHVDPLNGGSQNSDSAYMAQIIEGLNSPRVFQVPSGLNAAQLKHVIAACRFFIGGRTHATIAAWSSLVPTISLAYSTKALGLNRDLFGTQNYVLDSSEFNDESLWSSLAVLFRDESKIRGLLTAAIPSARLRTVETRLAIASVAR